MSLKELRTLAPFFWDSKASKHPVGAKGRRDFEEVRAPSTRHGAFERGSAAATRRARVDRCLRF
jgi:hypothetical protein